MSLKERFRAQLQRKDRRATGSARPPRSSVSPTGEDWPEVSFQDRLGTVEFRVAPDAHIVVDSDVCQDCSTQVCVHACPANLFAPTADGGIVFNYEQCFECGTCYMVCNNEGAITWNYPEGGAGVVFRHS